MPGSRLVSFLFLSMALVFSVGGCAANTEGESGALSLELVINGGTEIDEVKWTITQGEEVIKAGTVNTSANGATASVEAYGLEPGDYTIMMEAMSTDGETTCMGKATFSIQIGEVTEVHVMMNCKPPRRFGGVRADGTFNICPALTWADASPLQTSVGNAIDLAAMATDEEGDPTSYMWSSGSGLIADPTAATTTYTCTEAGNDTITIRVTDDGGTYCMDMHDFPITCVAGEGDLCEDVICEDDRNECTDETCNPANGMCETANNTKVCDGGNGTCNAGVCEPNDLCTGVTCTDDGNECTDEACNPANGMCETTNNTNACDGGNGTCNAGVCEPSDLCIGVTCTDDGNECTDEACNPANGMCETTNNTNACDGGNGTCSAGVCVPSDLCAGVTCTDDGNECTDEACNPANGMCETTNNTNACDGGAGTCNAGVCEPNDLCAGVTCTDDGNECTDEACNPANGMCETTNNTNACDGGNGTCSAGVCEPNAQSLYNQDFESLVADNANALADDGWLYFGNVFDGTQDPPTFKFGFGAFVAPTTSGQISAIAIGEGGAAQGAQQLSVFSNYDCCGPGMTNEGHFNGTDLVETIVFQEINPIPADLVGQTVTFFFEAKGGNIELSTTAEAFVRTLDPTIGFAVTNNIVEDMTSLSKTDWAAFSITLDIGADLDGKILQFGFSTIAKNFEGAGNFYDNVMTTASPTP